MNEIARSDFDISPEFSDSILPLLYQTGYLTIKGYSTEDESYTLGYRTGRSGKDSSKGF